jgi:hypothetical protein
MDRRIILATALSVALVTTSATAAVMAAIRPAEAPSTQTVAADLQVPNGPADAGALATSDPQPVEVETIYVDEYITAPAPAPTQTLTAATSTHDAFDDNGGDRDRDLRVESGDDRDEFDDDDFDDEFDDDDEDDEDDDFDDEFEDESDDD